MTPLDIIFAIIILIMSVVIHEVSHGYMASYLGDPTARLVGRLTLNPLKHLDPIGSFVVPLITSTFGFVFGWAKPVPYNPHNLRGGKWGPALVAVAGPGANIVLALIAGSCIRFGLAPLGTPFGSIALLITAVNIVLAVFNMIPLPPLDGSKVLFALLPYSLRMVEETMNRYQLVFLAVLIFMGLPFVGNVVQVLLGLIVTPLGLF